MGAVQRLATVVIIGLVALATILVLYLADENNRIKAEEVQQRDAAIERAIPNFIGLCLPCHGPAGEGASGADAKYADGSSTGRIGGIIGGVNTTLNQTGVNAQGTPWPGTVANGITYPAGFVGRTEWIRNRITNGLLNPDGRTYRMPPFSEALGGSLNESQIDDLVTMIQYGDWNLIYNEAIATAGGYPTPPPPASTASTSSSSAAAPTAAPSTGSSNGGAATSLTLDLEDIKFSTDSMTIPANTDVTLTITNKGATVHNFNIDSLDIHSGDMNPGETKTITINAPAGSYEYYCNIPGHKEAGMDGTLTVTAGGGSGGGEAAGTPVAGNASASTAAAGAGNSAGGSADLSIALEDIQFDKTELDVAAGTQVTVTITNKGATVHNFNIDALNVHSGDVQPGQTTTVTFTAPAGNYEYYCNIPGHKEAGMVGTLVAK